MGHDSPIINCLQCLLSTLWPLPSNTQVILYQIHYTTNYYSLSDYVSKPIKLS